MRRWLRRGFGLRALGESMALGWLGGENGLGVRTWLGGKSIAWR